MIESLSVIIPAYNEEDRIRVTIDEILKWRENTKFPCEIIVVDDGSTDKTREVLKDFISIPDFKIISYRYNMGKGYAVKTGMLEAKGQIRLFMDADNSTTIEHFDLMLPFFERDYDVVIGSRHKRDAEGAMQVKPQFFVKRWLGQTGNFLVRKVLGLPFYDTQCGFKAFKEDAAVFLFGNLKTYGWAFDMEILRRACIAGLKIGVIPVKWYNKEGSKVKPLDYFKTLMDAMKIRKITEVRYEQGT